LTPHKNESTDSFNTRVQDQHEAATAEVDEDIRKVLLNEAPNFLGFGRLRPEIYGEGAEARYGSAGVIGGKVIRKQEVLIIHSLDNPTIITITNGKAAKKFLDSDEIWEQA